MTLAQARETAKKLGLDLLEVSPTAVPPVCRLVDYGKFKYQQAKKEQEAKKHQKVSMVREIRIRPKIGEHDFQAKSRSARKLLSEGAKVKVTVMFRGREITHPDLGRKLLQRMFETLKDMSSLESLPMLDGKRMAIVVAPQPTKVEAKTPAKTETKAPAKAEAKTPAKVEAKKETQDAKNENP